MSAIQSEDNDKNKKKNPKKVNDFRVWKHSHNLKNENIIGKATINQTTIKQKSSELNGEENFENRKKSKHNQHISNNKEKYGTNNNLSENVQKIVNDVSKTIENINKSTEEIKKLNALYLINTSQKINKQDKSGQVEENSKNVKINETYLPPIKEEQKSRNQPTNFKYINDNYRKQLNRAFLNFNPIIHLGNLNILRKADPEINKDIEKLTKHIEDDLSEITNKNYYHNQYEKIVEQNKKRKKRSENSSENTAPTAPTEPGVKANSQIYKPIFRKKMKNRKSIEIKKKFPEQELEEKTLSLMESALAKISNTLDEKNMNKYFNDYKCIIGMDIKQQSHQYFPGVARAADILKEIQHEKIIRDLNERTNRRKKVLHSENEMVIKEIYEKKKNLLKEIEKQEHL